MAGPKITLYVDTISPFAYMAFWALENLPTFKDVEKTYVPILLGGLLKQCGNPSPIEVTNKAQWINTERQRWASLFHIPMQPQLPANFPVSTVLAQRCLAAVQQHHPPAQLAACIAALYRAFFVDHALVAEPATVARVLAGVLPAAADIEAVIAVAQTGEGKACLVRNTQAAFEDGAFGLPWVVATNSSGEVQKFWGFDHLGQLADFLGLDRPTTGGWRAVL